jgi:N-hydroxyarylamine O-acetyltransferase
MTFEIDTYLKRVGLPHCPATAEGLALLQSAQARAIPFENLDPFLGRTPDLDPDAIWRKLVLSRRGGYCFELNGLYGAALGALGFAVRPILARVRMGAPEGGPRTHLAWIASIDGRQWLTDCGFGGPGSRVPLGLDDRDPQPDGIGRYRLWHDPASGETVVQRETSGDWFPLFGFVDEAPRPVDIETANVVCCHWERSVFPRNLMVNLSLPDGRISLLNAEGRIERRTGTETWAPVSSADLHRRLAGDFGIEVTDAVAAELWRRIAPAGRTVD